MRCRKNQATLTATEKAKFVAALLGMKASGKYDQYVAIHEAAMNSPMMYAHRGPAFPAWHRELLRRFELDLQAIDATVRHPIHWGSACSSNNPPSHARSASSPTVSAASPVAGSRMPQPPQTEWLRSSRPKACCGTWRSRRRAAGRPKCFTIRARRCT